MEITADHRRFRTGVDPQRTEWREPSTDSLDLASLPERLDDATMARVQDIANSPLPPLEPTSQRHFNQTLRVMLAVLPKRSSDDVSGELFVAAYQRKLGHYCENAISFMADKALERCQWFPTIAECIEILGEWRRNDDAVQRRDDATRAANRERHARQREKDKLQEARQFCLTQADVDKLPDYLRGLGVSCGALIENADGTFSPRWPKADESEDGQQP